jgi:hypothetical protein
MASILAVISLSAFLGGILGLALWAFWFFASREGRRESGEGRTPEVSIPAESVGSVWAASNGASIPSAAAHPALPQTHTDLLYSEGGKEAVFTIRFYAEDLDEAVRGGRFKAANAWSAFMHLQVWMKVLEARTNMGSKKEAPR